MPEPAPPPTASPVADAAQDISIPTDGRGAVLGLEIAVLENIEKRTMEGTELMRIGLRLRANGQQEDVGLTSPGREEVSWGGYHIRYRRGWRQQVDLTVTRVAP